MLPISQSVHSGVCRQVAELMTVSEASKRFNLHPNTLRNWTARGKLQTLKTIGGHRRISPKAIEALLGIKHDGGSEENNGQIKVAAVVRVSSAGQNIKHQSSDKSSLDYQKERVKEYIETNYANATVEWYVSVGSGLNFERPEFLRLVSDVLAGKYRGGVIVATDFTRICRFGAKLFEHICKIGGAEIVYTLAGEKEEKTENESLVDDVLSVLTHFTAKASGAKTRQIVTVHMKQSDLDEAWELYSKKSWSQAAINDKFIAEGRTGTTASGKVKKLTRGPIYRRLTAYFELKRKVAGETQQVNSFEQWAIKHIKRVNDGGKFNDIGLTAIRAAYGKYCKDNNLHAIYNRGILKYLTEQGFSSYVVHNGMRKYKGMMILERAKDEAGMAQNT